ncbi:hypothetical protein ACHAXS_003220, partial [Conticribra weissflogii]
MNLLRGLFHGGEDPPASQSTRPPPNNDRSSRYNSHDHGWHTHDSRYDYRTNSNDNNNNHNHNRHHHHHHPDIYLSDDDDWGMSALSPTPSSLNPYDRPASFRGARDSRKHNQIFWDQEVPSTRGGASVAEVGGSGGGGGGGSSSSLGSGSGSGSGSFNGAD